MADGEALIGVPARDRPPAPVPAHLLASAEPPFAFRRHNRKVPAPSLLMHPPDGNRYRCAWLEDSITVHSDGNVTCGLDDPDALRSFGNVHSQPVEEIFRNPEYDNLRRKLRDGYRCRDCTLYQRLPDDAPGPAPRPPLPTTLVVEPTVRCNIRCLNQACFANNDASLRTRDADMLRFPVFVALVDQLRGGLRHVYFFNYGDPFVNARAEDMLQHLRDTCPGVEIATSTNGIPLAKPARAARVAAARPDFITFTIGGVFQHSYERYHGRGDVALALQGMRNVLEARRALGAARPTVIWRYLLFRWNDGDAEIARALELAAQYGVDQFILYLTHMPIEGVSFRFAPGTPNFARHRPHIDSALDYAAVCGIPQPDADGFFPPETIVGLGPLRWTGWQARLHGDGRRGWIRLALSTNRPAAKARETEQDADSVFVLTPWRRYKVPLAHMRWREVCIRVPTRFRDERRIPVMLVTLDHWFPAAEIDSPDLRCLGVLVRDPAAPAPPASLALWQDTEKLAGLTAEDEAGLDALPLAPPPGLVAGNAGRLAAFDHPGAA